MRIHTLKATLNAAMLAAVVLLFGAAAAFGQAQQINLTVAPTTTTLPDGTTVPMWGYFCTPLATNVTSTATCSALNPASVSATVATSTWSPVVITVPFGQDLQINLTNSLTFTPTTAGATANNIPTSLVIVGQLGGGLGSVGQRTATASPDHSYAQGCVTWPIASIAPGDQCNSLANQGNNPPATSAPTQGDRVQSFSTEVAAGATTSLCWGVCTTGGSASLALKPGTYLIESGTHPSIQGPMGLYGILVVTTAPAGTTAGTAYPAVGTTPAVTYSGDVDLLFSEIDPVQNKAVSTAVNTSGFSETKVWSGQPGQCGNPGSPVGVVNTCYPPAVNYTPLYYLINGLGFNKTNAAASQFSVAPAPGSGNVLVRMVNAGLRMHVPAIVGSQTTGQTGASTPIVTGFQLIAEDGNRLPGVPRVQSEVFMAAGKTYDVMFTAPAACTPVPPATTCGTSLPVYDRELSLSANSTGRDGGMLAYISINGSGLPATSAIGAAVARADTYNSVVAGQPFKVSDPIKGLIANDTNVYGVQLLAAPTAGTVVLNANGTFTYTPATTFSATTGDRFTYCANGSVTVSGTVTTCSSGITATVSLGACGTGGGSGVGPACNAGGVSAYNRAYTAKTATSFAIKSPGVLGTQYDTLGNPADSDSSNYPLSVVPGTAACGAGTVQIDAQGGLSVSLPASSTTPVASSCHFQVTVKNSQGSTSATTTTGNPTVTINFPGGSGLQVTVLDGANKTTQIGDYRWIIEEDRTFYVDPNCTTNSTTQIPGCPAPPAAGSTTGATVPPTFGVNFHTSYMPVVASGCTGPLSCEGGQTMVDNNPSSPTFGQHLPAVCDVGNGVCRPDSTGNGFAMTLPNSAVLDPAKRYYISILPGDAANPFIGANGSAPANCAAGAGTLANPNTSCGHGMGGAPIAAACVPVAGATTCTGTFAPVTILTQPSPYPPAQLSVFVFEDDFPLNGEHDAGGGTGAVNTNNEPGLGGFEITLFDDAGGTGDATGQLTHDMFNQPLSNSLAGTIDPLTGKDACPLTPNALAGMDTSKGNAPGSVGTIGISGRIVTCPEFEADGVTPSPLAGQAVVPNMMQGRYGVVATPAADRIARGEEWLQTNTLDGQKAHDSFLRLGGPAYFQEFGPAGWHVAIGFANPKIINSRLANVCAGTDPFFPPGQVNCNNTVTGLVTTTRMSRTPDERLFGSGDNSSFAFTQCYVSFGDPDGEDFAFTKCDQNGNFTLSGLPDGNWRITVFDQWNDMLVDGLSTPVGLAGGSTVNLGQLPTNQWQANIYTSTFFDANGDGVRDNNEEGLTLVSTNIRFRDGSYSNFNNTDLSGNAGFNEVFPLFSWYVVENDSTRYKSTGVHVVYDAGGPADGTLSTCGGTIPGAGYPGCGNSTIGHFMANTYETNPLPGNLSVPGAVYCSNADCKGSSIANGPVPSSASNHSTGRIDPPFWFGTEGWQGFSGQNNFLEFGKKPYAPTENGGIHGEVNYASTRPFDDPQLLLHVSWTPDVPNVTVNLYQEGFGADGVTPTLKLVDTTTTSSWDDWAQGFRSDGMPNMNCPGQSTADLFYFSLYNQPDYLDVYNNQHSGTAVHNIPMNSQFKCYDGMHNWNQLQPAVYDGMYHFPSVTSFSPTTGIPTGTNCTICVPNPDMTDPYRKGTPMLPAGKYVVEVVVPPGYELVKEEDKNILIGDNYIAPVTQQFGGLGSIYIIPDQASIGASYNANNAQNPSSDLGTLGLPRGEGDTGSVEQFWPCVGEMRVVPDFMSIFPGAQEVAAFAGATRPLCDRKEITLQDQMSALAKFYIFTSAHVAAHFTGVITDDFTSEFDPFSPQFGEKFSPPDLPVSIKDWAGNEISRVYADHWGTYDGLTYSSWEVNPPNPTGYGPTMMVTCMNDPGPILDTRPGSPTLNQMITDPLFAQGYSQFCYEIPFMPGQTQYMDTPVVPTSAFAGAGYNNVDCAYPDTTPAVSEVDGDGLGPWVSSAGNTLTINALGDQMVPNYAYTGPQATTAPYNQKTIKRHYGFGGTAGTVTIGGVPATVTAWSDTQIKVTVPPTGTNNSNMVQPCFVQQQAQYGGSTAYCGELVITTAATSSGTGGVTGVTVANQGNGYTARATVTFTNTGTGGTGAAATNTATTGVFMGVSRVTIPAGGIGRGYTSPPLVTFTPSPAGASATAAGTAVLGTGTTAGRVVGVTITSAGSGYTARPTVTFAPPTCTPLGTTTCATATLTNSASAGVFMDVLSVVMSSGGTGYTSAPTLTVSTPGCTINTTTCIRATAAATASPLVNHPAQQSVDTVTVTIGGKAPTHVAPSASIQAAIDAAAPGDMIIVDPAFTPAATAPPTTSCATATAPTTTCVETSASHNEMVIMWKPVRLQGVAAATSIINANTHPAGNQKLSAWRQQVACLFGLGLNGSPINTSPHTRDVNAVKNVFDPTGQATCGTGWNYFTPFDESGAIKGSSATNPQVDRLPLEATVGWDANLNGNLAELLQEPSLMGALEGAAITVLAKGVTFPSDPFDPTLLAGFPTGTTLLTGIDPSATGNFPLGDANVLCHTVDSSGTVTSRTNPFPSDFTCNPSSIDGLGITDSSQGGGGIFVHGWGHNIQIANNRIYGNAGTLSGGINIGQGEFGPSYVQGSATNASPGSCEDSPVPGATLPFCQNINVNVHNNYISLNSSTGDELFSATPAGAGGVSFCTGADYYKFNYNWVCGNLSNGDGGGFGHLGFSYNGDIEHNTIIFNQSINPTIPANGGGLTIMGAPDADLICNNSTVDQDCAPFGAPGGNPGNTPLSGVTPSDGVGPGLVINANLIMGNGAEAGTGGGIAFTRVNGGDMVAFPSDAGQWNSVLVTNNIIVDNVSGWDGGAISLLDSPNVNIINNTIAHNNSTATAGILFNTLGAPLASQGGTSTTGGSGCTGLATTTCPQPAGLVAIQHSPVLMANLPASVPVICPAGHFQTTATNGSCKSVSYPKLENNIFWQNGSFYIGVSTTPSPAYQQNLITLFNMGGSAMQSQGTTGACVSNTHFWDIGVRGDTGPTNHASGVTLTASDSVLTSGASSVLGSGNATGNPNFTSQYCDGSRTPPEAVAAGLIAAAAAGWQVPPGISDATVPNPIFNLAPSATVDEGNNWVNLRWGPLSMTNPTVLGADGNYGGGAPLGNYSVTTGSSASGRIGTGSTNYNDGPNFDFFNHPRKPGPMTAGAIQITGGGTSTDFTVSPQVVDFGFVPVHSPTTTDQDVLVTNTGNAPLSFNSNSFAISCATVTSNCNTASFRIQTTAIGSITVVNGGTGYAVGDVLQVMDGAGASGASVTVTAVSATGAITALTINTAGNGYTNPNVTFSDLGGTSTGTGATGTITTYNPSTCVVTSGTTTLAPGGSCVVNTVFLPTSTSHAVRNAALSVNPIGNGAAEYVLLTGHDSFGTLVVSPPGSPTPAAGANNVTVGGTQTIATLFNATTPNTAAVTATITLTNTQNICAQAVQTGCPPGSNIDAGTIIPSAITLTKVGTAGGTFALGGTCAVGTAINPGGTLVPPATGSSCTITITYTPPAGATGAALNGSARLRVTGYGVDPTTVFINAVYRAN